MFPLSLCNSMQSIAFLHPSCITTSTGLALQWALRMSQCLRCGLPLHGNLAPIEWGTRRGGGFLVMQHLGRKQFMIMQVTEGKLS